MGPRQNGHHSTDDIFKCISSTENFSILNEIPLKYIPCGLIGNIKALLAIIALRWTGDKPLSEHDDVIKWKHFPRYWPFVREFTGLRGIPRTKGQWRGALILSLICVWINGWVNNHEAGDLRRYRAHCDVSVMANDGLSDWHIYASVDLNELNHRIRITDVFKVSRVIKCCNGTECERYSVC